MKKPVMVLLVLMAVALGFLVLHGRRPHVDGFTTNASANHGTLLTNGGVTWNLGKVVVNGTNVPMTNITVGVK